MALLIVKVAADSLGHLIVLNVEVKRIFHTVFNAILQVYGHLFDLMPFSRDVLNTLYVVEDLHYLHIWNSHKDSAVDIHPYRLRTLGFEEVFMEEPDARVWKKEDKEVNAMGVGVDVKDELNERLVDNREDNL